MRTRCPGRCADTVRTVEGYADCIVLRHFQVRQAGPCGPTAGRSAQRPGPLRISSDASAVRWVAAAQEGSAQRAANVASIPILNAGDGPGQHPSQVSAGALSSPSPPSQPRPPGGDGRRHAGRSALDCVGGGSTAAAPVLARRSCLLGRVEHSAWPPVHVRPVPQALLDVYTIQREVGRLNDIKIGMVGDLLHGRTVRSLCMMLSMYKNVQVSGGGHGTGRAARVTCVGRAPLRSPGARAGQGGQTSRGDGRRRCRGERACRPAPGVVPQRCARCSCAPSLPSLSFPQVYFVAPPVVRMKEDIKLYLAERGVKWTEVRAPRSSSLHHLGAGWCCGAGRRALCRLRTEANGRSCPPWAGRQACFCPPSCVPRLTTVGTPRVRFRAPRDAQVDNLAEVAAEVDVLYQTRIQKERFTNLEVRRGPHESRRRRAWATQKPAPLAGSGGVLTHSPERGSRGGCPWSSSFQGGTGRAGHGCWSWCDDRGRTWRCVWV